MKLYMKTWGALLAASLSLYTSAHAQDYVFNGSDSSDPEDALNYNNYISPGYGSTVLGSLDVDNPAGDTFLYTSGDGTTVFTGYLDVGVATNVAGSSFQMTGGSLTFTGTSFPNAVGFNSTSSISVSGGTLNFDGTYNDNSGGGIVSFWLSNQSTSVFNISDGTVNIQNELAFSRNGGAATLNITGGVFDVQGTAGTLYNSATGSGTARINLGDGLFEETDSSAINLGGNFLLNFTTGSTGQFSLFGESASSFDSLINAGDVQVNGAVDKTLADFSTTTSGGQGILTLATAAATPEPSTWAMLIGGFALLLGVQRLSRKRSV
jgi:hypothetical protein